MSERHLAAASERLRGAPGFPRRPGRPRTRLAPGHNDRQAVDAVAQPRTAASENEPAPRAGVSETPVVALEASFGAVVMVAPALLSIADSARYLGISTRSLEGYVAAGILVGVRLPSPRGGRHLGRVLLERAELDRLVARARGRS